MKPERPGLNGAAVSIGASGLDLLSDDFLRDPYPHYAALRRHDPAHRLKGGTVLLTRHADVVEALGDRRLSNAPAPYAVVGPRNLGRFVCADVAANILPFLDKPQHVAPRRIVAEAWRGHLRDNPPQPTAVARRLIAPMLAKGGGDVIGEFGQPLSIAVMGAIFGLEAGDHAELARLSDFFFYLFAPMPSNEVRLSVDAALTRYRAYFASQLSRCRSSPERTLIGRLLATESDGARLSEEQVVDSCMLLFSDGVENVHALIANALLALGETPGWQERLGGTPELATAIVEETLRYDTPGQIIGRIASEPMELHGRRIAAGTAVLLALGSANRDPEAFAQPDRFDPDRPANMHLAFGKGRHSCLGGALVRMQAAAALQVLAEAGARVAIDRGALTWQRRVGHRWLTGLPVHLR